MVKAVYDNYKNNPKSFVNHINSYGFNKKLNMDFKGEGKGIYSSAEQNWSNISPMDGFRLWVSVTPMQTLAFYNAVANNGVMVKPQFVSEIKEWNKTIKMDKEVINPRICSPATILKLKAVLANVVKGNRV
jgi:cell division protein FtsI (penicillin-binding protein 3)